MLVFLIFSHFIHISTDRPMELSCYAKLMVALAAYSKSMDENKTSSETRCRIHKHTLSEFANDEEELSLGWRK